MSHGFTRARALAALLVLGSGGSLALPTKPLAQTPETAAPITTAAEVRVDNFTFSPPILTVTAGATVTWINGDDIPHTIAAKDRSFRSKALDTDGPLFVHVHDARRVRLLLHAASAHGRQGRREDKQLTLMILRE